MSPLVLLGSLGTILSTMSMLPHLVHAVKNRKPAGSAFAWAFGACCSSIWLVYGIGIGNLLVAGPNFVATPVGFLLAAWCTRDQRRSRLRLVPEPSDRTEEPSVVFVPVEWEHSFSGYQSGDTLELPRIA